MEKIRGAIIVNAYHEGRDYHHQPIRLREEFRRRDVEIRILRSDELLCLIDRSRLICRLKGFSFVVYLDKDRYLLKAIEEANIPVYNRYEALTTADDKMLTFLALADKGIPLPKTIPGPLCYVKDKKIGDHLIHRIETRLFYPFILKECCGSLGKAVYLIKDHETLLKRLEQVKMTSWLVQEDIMTSYGEDVRVIVVGDQVLGAIKRKAKKGFRSNISRGGTATVWPVDEKLKELSLRITRLLHLDFAGLDFLFTDDGYVLSEVNSNAFYKTFEAVTGINVAGSYADYILETLKGERKRP